MSKSYIAHCQSGYYAYDRAVSVHHALNSHPYAQCGYNRFTDNEGNTVIQFVSYETIVCEIVNDWLHCYGTFSNTTAKQIGWFLREMRSKYTYRVDLATYQTAKQCYNKGIEINLYNGNERKASEGMIQTVGTRVNTDW